MSPKDCLTAVQLVEKAGLLVENVSFAQLISTALMVSLESMRRSKIVEDGEGFDYWQVMSRFQDQPHIDRAKKLKVTDEFRRLELATHRAGSTPGVTIPSQGSTEVRAARRRIDELNFKMEATPESFDTADQEELLRMVAVINGTA